MIKISQAKKIRRDTCLAVGHELVDYSGQGMSGGAWFNSKCSRCKRKFENYVQVQGGRLYIPTSPINTSPQVKYADLNVKRSNILDRINKIIDLNMPEET